MAEPDIGLHYRRMGASPIQITACIAMKQSATRASAIQITTIANPSLG